MIVSDDVISRREWSMSDHHDPHTGLHSEQGALAGEHPGRARQADRQGARPGLAGVREARPASGRRCSPVPSASRRRCAPQTNCSCAARIPARPACSSAGAPARGSSVRPSGRPTRRDVLRLADATGRTVVPLPESLGGIRSIWSTRTASRVRVVVGHARTAGAARAGAAAVQRRARRGAGERHPAAAARAGQRCSGSVTSCCRRRGTVADAQLVPRAPRPDRQRLPLLPGAARARARS